MSRDWLFVSVKLSSTLLPTHVVRTFAPRAPRTENRPQFSRESRADRCFRSSIRGKREDRERSGRISGRKSGETTFLVRDRAFRISMLGEAEDQEGSRKDWNRGWNGWMVSRQMKIELARIVRGGGMDGEVAPLSCWSTRRRFLWPSRDRLKWKSARQDGGLARVARWRRCLYSKLRNLIAGTFKKGEPHHLRQTRSLSFSCEFLSTLPSSHVEFYSSNYARCILYFLLYLARLTRELIIGRVRGWSKVWNVSKRPQRVSFLCKDSFATATISD